MLSYLQIRDYAIIDSLELEPRQGFTCITGETGAGKSILVGALGLLCGNRADTAAIRQGSQKAELVAEFELDDSAPALAWLKETELDDGTACHLRRVITANGRSRAWINGTAVSLQQLAGLGELLVEIHGQNEHLRLTRRDEQFRLLDGGGSHEAELHAVREGYFAWQELEREKQALLAQSPLDPGELELLAYQVDELESSVMTADEFRQLETEHQKLAQGGDIVASLEAALQSLQAERSGAAAELHRTAAQLEVHATLDEDIAEASALLNEAAINCDEAANSIQSALARMDLSPERLSELQGRLERQHDLARKHRAEPEQLAEVLEQLRIRLELSATQEKRLAGIDVELESASRAYRSAALRLHKKRRERARELSRGVTELMQELGMDGGRFEFAVELNSAGAPTALGDDHFELNVAANRGGEPAPLRKVASGGELSRISLAVKIVARERDRSTTQVFDEVDAGIGGATANAVGSLLKSLSHGAQALCVTHLAQVAAFADRQLLVSKGAAAEGTTVSVFELDDGQRVDEVARMLGGQVSAQSRAHASELLNEASASRH